MRAELNSIYYKEKCCEDRSRIYMGVINMSKD